MELKPITRQEKIIAGKDLEPITRMEKFLKNFGGGGGGGVQPDWNQNDIAAPDYVKNRPFWREKTKELMFPDITGPIEVTTEDNGSGIFFANGRFNVYRDATNYVVFDGVEYTCEPYYDETAGNTCIGSLDFSNYPFFITKNIIATKTAGNHTVLQYFDLYTIQADYGPHLVIRTLKTADGTPYLAMEDVEKIKVAFKNGVPIRLLTSFGKLSTIMRVNDCVYSGFISASGFGSIYYDNIMTQIEYYFSTSDGSLHSSCVSHFGSIKEDTAYYPLMYIGNRRYKITVGDGGTLTATEVT